MCFMYTCKCVCQTGGSNRLEEQKASPHTLEAGNSGEVEFESDLKRSSVILESAVDSDYESIFYVAMSTEIQFSVEKEL